jgi:ferrochelatase
MHTVVPAWYNRPGYVRSVGRLVCNELAQYTAAEAAEGGLHVLFSAHGVPQSYIEAGDPYQRQMEECVTLISEQLPKGTTVHLSYQSRVGPVEWLRPYTDDVIPALGELIWCHRSAFSTFFHLFVVCVLSGLRGVKNLVVVPISFVSEHIETLEEIDIEYRELAEGNGVARWRRCPALNTDEDFIRELATMVGDALREPALSVSAACIQNNCEVVLENLEQRSTPSEPVVAGVTEGAEKLNGRIAMVGIFSVLLLELFSGQTATKLLESL